jgi:hypothetical protein
MILHILRYFVAKYAKLSGEGFPDDEGRQTSNNGHVYFLRSRRDLGGPVFIGLEVGSKVRTNFEILGHKLGLEFGQFWRWQR